MTKPRRAVRDSPGLLRADVALRRLRRSLRVALLLVTAALSRSHDLRAGLSFVVGTALLPRQGLRVGHGMYGPFLIVWGGSRCYLLFGRWGIVFGLFLRAMISALLCDCPLVGRSSGSCPCSCGGSASVACSRLSVPVGSRLPESRCVEAWGFPLCS